MKAKLLILVAAVPVITACADKPKIVATQLKSWHEMQDSYAEVIAATGRLGKSTTIVPVKDFVFPIGTPLNADSSMPRSVSCQIPKEAVFTGPFAALPAISSTTSWGAVAAARGEYTAGIGDLGVDLQQARNLYLAYVDLSFQMVPDLGVDEHYRQSSKCLSDIDDRPISIVRGYIFGRLRLKSNEFDKASAQAKIKKLGGFDVRYTDGGEISIDEEHVKPRFMILSRSLVSSKCRECPIGVAQLTVQEQRQVARNLENVELAQATYQALARGDEFEVRRREAQAATERAARESEAGRVGRRAPALVITP
jgi:hypothetical protein